MSDITLSIGTIYSRERYEAAAKHHAVRAALETAEALASMSEGNVYDGTYHLRRAVYHSKAFRIYSDAAEGKL